MDYQTAAIITGAGSGMGEASARYLAAQGTKLCLIDKNKEAVTRVAEDVGGLAFSADVSDDQAIAEIIERAGEAHGIARICVNCAGIAPAGRIVGKEGPMALEAFSQVIQTNLIGTFNVLRLAASAMYAAEPLGNDQQRGVIINTASIAAFEGQLGQAAYAASKGGVVSMALPAAREFAKFGIRVNTIAPGTMATPMLLNMPEKVQQNLAESVCYPKRLGSADEFAQTVAFLIENDYINGAVMRLDGALRMQ